MADKKDVICLEPGETYEWYPSLSQELHAPESAGELTIIENITKENNKKNKVYQKNADKLYKAQDSSGSTVYVKSERQTDVPMPYTLTEAGVFEAHGRTYYVYECFDGSVGGDLFRPNTPLGKYWAKAANDEKERIAAGIFLQMMFIVRAFWVKGRANLDLKPANALYRFKDGLPECKMIDLTESSHYGAFEATPITLFIKMGSPHWMAPAIYYLFAVPDEKKRDNIVEQAKAAAGCCDIYSMGLVLYWLYSDGTLLRLDGLQETMFQNAFQDLYYSETAQEYKTVTADKLTFSDGHAEKIIALIQKMLALPAADNGGDSSRSAVRWCDELISEYCAILAECGRLPEMEIPAGYLPPSRRFPDAANVVIRLTVTMSGGGIENGWTEYRCFQMKDGDVCNLSVTLYHIYPGVNEQFRQEYDDFMFLYADGGEIYYNTKTNADGRVFGRFENGKSYRYAETPSLLIEFERVV